MGKLFDKIRRIQDKTRPFCTAIIPAAGSSTRMGGQDKLLTDLCGAPVLMRTLCAIDRTELVDEIIRLACRTNAAAPAVPVTDTIKAADPTDGRVLSTPDRSTLFAVYTPQVIEASLLKAALQSAIDAGAEITDDCSAVERLGKEVYLATGSRENIKITTPLDLLIAEAILRGRDR